MQTENIVVPLKRFILIEHCPVEWKTLDLYLFRAENTAFYVGQSQLAFARVWEHLLGGFHGHSIVGRFVWVNWPASMNFSIELLSSQSELFHALENNLDAAERALIQRWRPCFNVSLNQEPTPLPKAYLPPNAKPRFMRSLNKMHHEAKRSIQAEEKKLWMQEIDDMVGNRS
jgi:hypothetical protein